MDIDFEVIGRIAGKTLYRFADGCMALRDPAGGYARAEISFATARALAMRITGPHAFSDQAAMILDMDMVVGPEATMREFLDGDAFMRRAREHADAILGRDVFVPVPANVKRWIATGPTNTAADLLIGAEFCIPGLAGSKTGRAWQHPPRLSATFPANCVDMVTVYEAIRLCGLDRPSPLVATSHAWLALIDHWQEVTDLVEGQRESHDSPARLMVLSNTLHTRLKEFGALHDAAPEPM